MRTFNSTVSKKKQFGNFYQKWQEKKQTLNTRIRTTAFLVLMGVLVLTGCSSDDSVTDTPDNPDNPVTAINSMSPEQGPKGTSVIISGTHFGTNPNAITININGMEADVLSVTDTEINFTVPPRAYNGDVMVTINGTEYTAGYFDYEISEVQVSTFAGTNSGDTNGTVATAKFDQPYSMAFDSEGYLFVVDFDNHKIKKISPNGNVSTFAGSIQGFADGTANAKFNNPEGIVIDADDNLYITDSGNHKIRKITRTGNVSTVAGSTQGDADGLEDAAQFYGPSGITIDAQNNLYVTDAENHKLKRITPDGMVTTIAGTGVKGYLDGAGSNAMFAFPRQLTLGIDNVLYVIEYGSGSGNHGVRKVTLDGVVTTAAGSLQSGYVNGTLEDARFSYPVGITTDDLGNIYVADEQNKVIRRISKSGIVTTLAGSVAGLQDGDGTTAKFASPNYLAIDADYNIYVADIENHRIRKITQE